MNEELLAYLEELNDLRRPARLRFFGDNGGIVSINAIITRLHQDGAEWNLTANHTLCIPLHRLLSVNDMLAQPLA